MDDKDSIPDFINLPLYQHKRVEPADISLVVPSTSTNKACGKRKRSNEINYNLAQCIQESLSESVSLCRDQEESNISFGGTVVPLPGFDDSLSCKLCCLRTVEGTFDEKTTGTGATLGEYLNIAHARFDQDEGRPAMDIANDILQGLKMYGQVCNISLLKGVTCEDVYRHFKFDHTRKGKPNMKDKMLRILMSMLDVSTQTCCEKSDQGDVTIMKEGLSHTLSIIDRIHKIASLKELD